MQLVRLEEGHTCC